jgi:hypothetical protein
MTLPTPVREIRLPAPHPRFRPRVEGPGRQAPHPGTAVRIGEDFFEVISSGNDGGEWIYRLAPWESGQVSRASVEWGDEAEREFLAEIRSERVRKRKKALAGGTQALLGFLPAKFQERLAETLGFDPGWATFWSAVVEISAALLPAVLFVLQFLGAGERFGARIPAWAGLLAVVALVEGVVRLIIAISSAEPVGCLFLALLGLRLKAETGEDVMSDEYVAVGEDLTVRSPVPKAWWERAGGVTYRGEPFVLTSSEQAGTSHLYRFRKGGGDFPEADPARERDRNISADRAYALVPLWGFLPRDFQRSLEFYGRYRPRPHVLISIAFNFLFSGSMIVMDTARISSGIFSGWIALRLAFAVVLLAESVLRLLRHLQSGEVSGSFLGVFIKPVYYMAVRGGPGESENTNSSPPGPAKSAR